MWDRIKITEINQAKQILRDRVAAARSRHEEEIKSLQVRQAEEIRLLTVKRTELIFLDCLIDTFMAELKGKDEPADQEPAAEKLVERARDGDKSRALAA